MQRRKRRICSTTPHTLLRTADARFVGACIIVDARSTPSQRLCYYISSQYRQAKVARYLRAVWNPITVRGLKRVYNDNVSRTTQTRHEISLIRWAVASPRTAAARTVCLSIIITGVCSRPSVTMSDRGVQATTRAPYQGCILSDISAQMHACGGTTRAHHEHDAQKALASLSLVRRQEVCGSEF